VGQFLHRPAKISHHIQLSDIIVHHSAEIT
jgi:hypothetical protein